MDNNQNFNNNYSTSQPAEQGYSEPYQGAYSYGAQYAPRIELRDIEGSQQSPRPSDKSAARLLWGIIGGLMAACLFIGIAVGSLIKRPAAEDGKQNVILGISSSPVTDTAINAKDGEPLTYAQVAAKVHRAVVGVNVYASSYGWGSYVFSEGSGFIISEDGYIITNSHVIQDDNHGKFKITVNVENEDGSASEYEVEVVGYDVRTDLAVVKIKDSVSGLVVAELGDSTALVLGDEVVAIGNPGGSQFAGSVTNGIVSGVDRVVGATASNESDSDMKYIQTNAAINPGNSGGPLLNMYGQVIGINSAKIVASGYEGLGFAIPMDKAKPIIESLIENGSVVRPTLNCTYSLISERMAIWYDVPVGLMIRSIENGSKLAEAGAQPGDIITACNGKDITTADELQDIIEKYSVGDKVTLRLFRSGEGEQFEIEAELVADNIVSQQTEAFN